MLEIVGVASPHPNVTYQARREPLAGLFFACTSAMFLRMSDNLIHYRDADGTWRAVERPAVCVNALHVHPDPDRNHPIWQHDAAPVRVHGASWAVTLAWGVVWVAAYFISRYVMAHYAH